MKLQRSARFIGIIGMGLMNKEIKKGLQGLLHSLNMQTTDFCEDVWRIAKQGVEIEDASEFNEKLKKLDKLYKEKVRDELVNGWEKWRLLIKDVGEQPNV